MRGEKDQSFSLELEIRKFIPIVSAIAFILAYLYEIGYSWQLHVRMTNILDVQDLAKTSLFIIPFTIFFLAFLGIARVSDALNTEGFDEKIFARSGFSSEWLERFFLVVASTGFILFLLFGGSWLSSTWFLFFCLFAIFKLEMKISYAFQLRFVETFGVRLLLLAAVVVLQQGARDAEFELSKEDGKTTEIMAEGGEWTVLRRYSSHIVAYNGSDKLALVSFEGKPVFFWSFKSRGWSGLLCDSAPKSDFSLWFREGCSLP